MASRLSKTLLALVAGLLVAVASSAWAAPAPDSPAATATACGTGASASAVTYLPVSRWADATTSFHSRLDADAWHDLAEKVQRNGTDSTYMRVGNAAWGLGTDALYASSTFCPVNVLGYPLDSLVGTIGNVLTRAGVLTVLVVATVVSALTGLRRGQDPARVVAGLLRTAAVMGVLSTMVLGAASSTEGAPGTGSPWWWVSQANTVVNSVSGTVAQAAVESSGSLLGYQRLSSEEGSEEDWPVTCVTTGDSQGYIDYLRGRYEESYESRGGTAEARGAALPAMVSSMWEASVLPVWGGAQFGTDNPYTDHVFCFFLEARSQSTNPRLGVLRSYVEERLDVSEEEAAQWRPKTKALITTGGNAEDQSLVGWAACVPSGTTGATVRAPWDTIEQKVKDQECGLWWAGGNDSLSGTSLDWDDKDDTVTDGTMSGDSSNPDLYNYVATLHGKDGTQLGSVMVVYLLGSLVNGAVLLLLALLQVASKLLLSFMVVGLFAALARCLAPGDDAVLLRRTGLQLVGAAFVSSCAGLMITAIMIVAGAVTQVAAQTFSPGTAGAVVATCTGPAVGTFMLHWVFTSVLRVPSPFTIRGAVAWGRGITTGAVGGAVGGAVAGMGANAREAVRRRRGTAPRPGTGRPGAPAPAGGRHPGGRNRSVFTSRSGAEALTRATTSGGAATVVERARADRDRRRQDRQDRRDRVRAEARRLADNDGRLGQADAWRGYTRRARASLRRARRQELVDRFAQAAPAAAARSRQGVSQAAARTTQGLSAAGALGSWAAHHPARAAAAAGVAGWRGAAAGARAAAAGAQVLRRTPARRAVAAGAGAALAVGAPATAAGVLAAGAGAALARAAAQAHQERSRQQAWAAAAVPVSPPAPWDAPAPAAGGQDVQDRTEPLDLGPRPAGQQEAEPAQAAREQEEAVLARARAAAAAAQAQAQARADAVAGQALERVRARTAPRSPSQDGGGPSPDKVG